MKRYLIELIGTFFLTLAVSFTGNPIAVGLMLMSMYCIGESISGGYFNPALVVAGFMRNLIALEEGLLYIGVQVFGAFLAARLVPAITNTIYMPDIGADTALGMSILLEALLMALFALVMLTLVSHKDFKGHTALNGAVLGLSFAALLFFPGLFNPAVAAGAMICQVIVSGGSAIASDLALVYVVAPLIGGAAAAFAYEYFHGRK